MHVVYLVVYSEIKFYKMCFFIFFFYTQQFIFIFMLCVLYCIPILRMFIFSRYFRITKWHRNNQPLERLPKACHLHLLIVSIISTVHESWRFSCSRSDDTTNWNVQNWICTTVEVFSCWAHVWGNYYTCPVMT